MNISEIPQRFDERPQRERVIMTVMAVLLTGLGLFQFLIDPALKKAALANNQLKEINARLTVLEAQVPALTEASRRDPNVPLDAAFETLKLALAKVEADIESRMDRLVRPSDMIPALQALLEQEPGVRLREVRNLEPVPLYVGEQIGGSGETQPDGQRSPDLYRHGLKIVIEGDYFSLLEYVLRVERHDGRFAWGSLNLTVEEYPLSRLEIELQTLSLEAGWLDV